MMTCMNFKMFITHVSENSICKVALADSFGIRTWECFDNLTIDGVFKPICYSFGGIFSMSNCVQIPIVIYEGFFLHHWEIGG